MKKVIIIDDEAAGRTLIKQYLVHFPDLILLTEANNGVDAVRLINEYKPDLIFLDVQMPGLSGFEVLKHLDEIPQVIFSTAFDQYALKAFEVHAVDYLLKPYTRIRFAEAVKRVLEAQSQNVQKIQPLADSLLNVNRFPEKILVQTGNRLITVGVGEVIWIEADGDYSRLITVTNSHLSNYGVGALENKLNPQHFLRVHRGAIININFIKEIQKYPSGYDIIMQNNDVVRVSRSYTDRIKDLIY